MDDPWSSPWGAQPTEESLPSSSDALPSWNTPARAPKAQATDDGWGASSGGGGWGDGNLDGGWGESVDLQAEQAVKPLDPNEFDERDEPTGQEYGQADEVSTDGEGEDDVDLTDTRPSSPPSEPPTAQSGFGDTPVQLGSPLSPPSPSSPLPDHAELHDVSSSPLPPPSSPPAFANDAYRPSPPSPSFSSSSPTQHSLPLPASDSFASFPSSPPQNTFPHSPSFDAGDFGGFSSPKMMDSHGDDDDPWGRGADNDDDQGGWSPSGVAAVDADEGDEWARPQEDASNGEHVQAMSGGGKVDEWEEARRLAAKRQARAPTHVLNDLSRQWAVLSTSLFPDPTPPAAEGDEAVAASTNELDQHLSKSLLEITEPSLSTLLPPSHERAISHQPFKLTVTARRFQDTLNRTNHLSASSILSSSNRRRPSALLSPEPATQEARTDWWGVERSMLGEPEGEAAPKEETLAPKRSFWSRKSSTMSISGVASVAGTKVGSSDVVTSPVVASGPSQAPTPPNGPSPRVSTSSARPSVEATASSSSRPTTPRPASPAPSQTTEPVAPSGVARFFGRWSKKPTTLVTSVTNADGTPKELELSGNDFDFLEEVQGPTTTRSGGDGDLMGDDEGGLDGFDGLDGFLGMGKKGQDMYRTPLPQKLEPPPLLGSRPPSRSPSAPPPPAPAAFNELDFLDFGGGSSTTAAPAPPPAAAAASSSFDMWDDFMATPKVSSPLASSTLPRTNTAAPIIPRLASPLPPPGPAPVPHVRASTGPAAPIIAPLAPPPARPSSTSPFSNGSTSFAFPPPPPPISKATTSSIFDDDDDDDFGDFDSAPPPPPPSQLTSSSSNTFTPTLPSSSSFGDFSSSPPPPPAPAPYTPSAIRTSSLAQQPSTPSTSEPPTPPTKSPRHAGPMWSPTTVAPPPVPKLAFPPSAPGGSTTGAGTDLFASMSMGIGGLVQQGQEQKGQRWPGPVSPGIPLVPGPGSSAGLGGWLGGEEKEKVKPPKAPVVPQASGGGSAGGGLSAQDLSFFDSL